MINRNEATPVTRTEIPTTIQPPSEVPSDPLALTFIVLFAASEIIGVSKLKSNSIIHLILRLISNFKPARREDEIISNLRQDIIELSESVSQLREAALPRPRTRRKNAE